ncbi:MAG: GxxExxY protein [Gemmatimonadaceae bacterium]|nr:GxxExxY protein [Gemmatimonadaceae bacterium]
MHVNDVTDNVLGAAVAVHSELGPGLLESVYEAVMACVLEKRGLHVRRQQPIRLRYLGMSLDEAFRPDLIIDDRVIVEIKAAARLEPVFTRQLLTYLRLTGIEVGLVINFGAYSIAGQTRRVVNDYKGDAPGKDPLRSPRLLFPGKSDSHTPDRRPAS